MKLDFSVVFLTLFYTLCYGQYPGLTNINSNHGLTSNTVYDIIEDSDGFIWFATDYGVSKFDGKNFTNFNQNDGLPGNEILYFFKDSRNRIWTIAFNGKVGFIKDGKIFNSNNKKFLKDLQFKNFINDIFEDSKGNIWFLENFKSIKSLSSNNVINTYRLNIEKKSHVYHFLLAEDKTQNIHIVSYIPSQNESNVITTPINSANDSIGWRNFVVNDFTSFSLENMIQKAGMMLKSYDGKINAFAKTININNNTLSKFLKINDTYWVSNSKNGVYIFNDKEQLHFLNGVHTTRSFKDSENNIWIGSQSNGVYFFPNLNITGKQFKNDNRNNLISVSVIDNTLILGNNSGEIIFLDENTFREYKSTKISDGPQNIREIYSVNNSTYILSDFNIHKINKKNQLIKLYNVYDNHFLNTRLVNFKSISSCDKYLYTANANGVARINQKTKEIEKLWDRRSTSILSSDTKLWIGTTNGLFVYQNGKTTRQVLNNNFDNSIIYDLKKINNCILIGSNSSGLGILNDGKFISYNKSNGLLSNYINSIFIDKKNTLWLSTKSGLNKIKLNTNNTIQSIESFTISDGLYSNDVKSCFVKDNKVYVATTKGLNIINLQHSNNVEFSPKIHIDNISINNILVEKTTSPTLSHVENNIQFNYSGISFKSLGNITFKYRLKGLEKDWIETENTSIRYSSLPPNKYTFEVQSISKNNIESENIASFSFVIKPPFYNTWWFRSLLLLTILGVFYTYFKNRIRIQQKELKIKEQISSLKYQVLNAQMNPHFINNLIMNIEELLNKENHLKAKKAINDFGRMVSHILQSTKQNLITLSDEMNIVTSYVSLQNIRFKNHINLVINKKNVSNNEFESIYVPPMILQPIVENSIKHGYKNEKENYEIVIDFEIKNNEYLICHISDNGTGINKANTYNNGVSLTNINQRLRLINDNSKIENFVSITNIKNEFNTLAGAKVTLKIPLITF